MAAGTIGRRDWQPTTAPGLHQAEKRGFLKRCAFRLGHAPNLCFYPPVKTTSGRLPHPQDLSDIVIAACCVKTSRLKLPEVTFHEFKTPYSENA